jgi:AbiV family abortive infection protein
MRVKAIQDLCQLPDTELFREIAQGATLCVANARQIQEDSLILSERQRVRGADILRTAAEEEASKASILLDAVRCPRLTQSGNFARQLKYFNEHLAKGIYAQHYHGRPATFGEVRQWVSLERKTFYLDGPNGVDWIFYNDILRRREENIYVDYVNYDEQHLWHDPARPYNAQAAFGGSQNNPVLRVANALLDADFFETSALGVVAQKWRSIDLTDDLHWESLRKLNFQTLEALEQSGLLRSQTDEIYREITNNWLSPLYSLDLRPESVDKDDLRKVQMDSDLYEG